MCRLFGFRSVISSQVHSSLISADNALAIQSSDHPDGWGVAYFLGGIPHVVKSVQAALSDNIFKRVSGVVSSQTVLAHIRKTTVGQSNILNTHPFQYGPWVFAHNGHIVDFSQKKQALKDHIDPKFVSYILGETDSEYIFYFLLTHLSKKIDLSNTAIESEKLINELNVGIKKLTDIVGEATRKADSGTDANYFTFVLTNGQVMLGHQRGKKLHYSTHKTKCPERETCSSFSPACENPVSHGVVNHLLISSEPLNGENIWNELEFGQTVAVNEEMEFIIK